MKKITIGFLGNIHFDTRTYNLFTSLKQTGQEVSFVGYDWLTEKFKTSNEDSIKVTKLNKRISFFFYLYFFFSQLIDFIKIKTDIYFSSDFYSLPASVIAAKLKHATVYYDSREIYTELPALENRPVLKKIFVEIEKFFIKRVDAVFTTGEMDSEYLNRIYNLEKAYLLRNLPLTHENIVPVDYHKMCNIPVDARIILYQGIIVHGRGIETYFRAVSKNEKIFLVLLGGGEHIDQYKSLSRKLNINERVIFAGKIPQSELLNYTAGAFAGLSLIDNISINNKYALPNKLFEYVMAGIPVITSDLPQMKKIVNDYSIGEVIEESSEDGLLEVINKWDKDKEFYSLLKENCRSAAKTLNWETEFSKVKEIFN
ncbi:glycosyltransferase [Bacteroidota bacterium]